MANLTNKQEQWSKEDQEQQKKKVHFGGLQSQLVLIAELRTLDGIMTPKTAIPIRVSAGSFSSSGKFPSTIFFFFTPESLLLLVKF